MHGCLHVRPSLARGGGRQKRTAGLTPPPPPPHLSALDKQGGGASRGRGRNLSAFSPLFSLPPLPIICCRGEEGKDVPRDGSFVLPLPSPSFFPLPLALGWPFLKVLRPAEREGSTEIGCCLSGWLAGRAFHLMKDQRVPPSPPVLLTMRQKWNGHNGLADTPYLVVR